MFFAGPRVRPLDRHQSLRYIPQIAVPPFATDRRPRSRGSRPGSATSLPLGSEI
jgi:hypothetical protein